ncbi:hypothetical protein II906_03275, partial [bacterium]|nr:hypothetical protein [bacterium]
VPTPVINRWEREGLFKTDNLLPRERYVDTTHPINIEFIEKLRQVLPASVSAGRFKFLFNYSGQELKRDTEDGKIIPLFIEPKDLRLEYMVDCADETNKETIEEHNKLKPFPMLKYYKGMMSKNDIWVPLSYLARLGFGTKDKLADMVKKGLLKGEYKIFQTKDGEERKVFCINTGNNVNETELKNARKANPFVISTAKYMKKYNMTEDEMNQALLSGDLEIIPRYIFESDYKVSFLDLNNEKNANYTKAKGNSSK